jgi:hypothetical protein
MGFQSQREIKHTPLLPNLVGKGDRAPPISREVFEIFNTTLCQLSNEAPRRKRRGIKRNSAEAYRLRSLSFGAVRPAIHPCGKSQGILAKANKKG